MANVIITGGSGFIGTNLSAALKERGHTIAVVDIVEPKTKVDAYLQLDLTTQQIPAETLRDTNAIVHLAGRNILGRVNEEHKDAIYQTRVLGTRNLIESLQNIQPRPAAFISASAVGYYGNRGDEEVDESAAPGGDFFARLCSEWEREARQAATLGIRTVQVRTAPVLGPSGILDRIVPLYRWGLGSTLGSGQQWFPWIHVQDLIGIYVFALENNSLSGPVNAVSPGFVTNKDFSDTLAELLHRPTLLKAPRWILHFIYKDLADAMLASQRVRPTKLLAAGYNFAFPDLKEALKNILGKK